MIAPVKENHLPQYLFIISMAVLLQFLTPGNAPAPPSSDTGREDPLVGFHYGLSFDGTTAGYFTDASGIGSESEIAEQKVVSEKGIQIVLKVPGRLKWLDVNLSRGMTSNMDLWNWRKMVEDGDVKTARKNFSIIMYDETLTPKAQWDFKNGWPAKIEAPVSSGTSAAGAVESITIVHEGMERTQ